MEEKMDDIFNYSGAIDRTQMQKSISNIGLKHIEINNDKDLEKYSKNNTISEIRRKKSKISKKDHHKFKKIKLLNDDDDIEIYDEEINEKKKNKSSKKDDIDISKLIEEKKKNNSLNTSNIQLSQDLDKKFIETKREIQSMKQLIKSQSLDLTEESVPQRKNTTRNTKKRTLDIVEEEEESFDYEQYKGDISLTIKHPSDFDYTEKYDININSSFKKIFEIYQEKYRILKDEVKFKYDGMVVKSEKKPKDYAMKSGDTIIAHFTPIKVSASALAKLDSQSEDEDGDKISLVFSSKNKQKEKMSFNKTDTFKFIMDSYKKKFNIKDKIKFLFDGLELNPSNSPETEDMEEDDMIEIKI